MSTSRLFATRPQYNSGAENSGLPRRIEFRPGLLALLSMCCAVFLMTGIASADEIYAAGSSGATPQRKELPAAGQPKQNQLFDKRLGDRVPGDKRLPPVVQTDDKSPTEGRRILESIAARFAGLHPGLKESYALEHWPAVKTDPSGCFGNKHQLLAKELGATLIITTLDGVIRAIRLLPPPQVVMERGEALRLSEILLGTTAKQNVQHDDEDVRLADVRQPVEYFYFKDGARVELTYSNASDKKIETFQVFVP